MTVGTASRAVLTPGSSFFPPAGSRFTILLCGGHEIAHQVRGILAGVVDVHVQFTSSPRFIPGRAMFTRPDCVIVDASLSAEALKEIVGEVRLASAATPMFVVGEEVDEGGEWDPSLRGISGFFNLPSDRDRLYGQIMLLVDAWRAREGEGVDAQPSRSSWSVSISLPLDEASMQEVQRRFAVKVLEFVHGNKSKAAYILRISRPRLDRILSADSG